MEEADNQKSAEADCNAKQPVSFEKSVICGAVVSR